MTFKHLLLAREPEHPFHRLTLNRPERRNPLALALIEEMLDALEQVAASDSKGLVIDAAGPVFSSGHDFADMVDADLPAMRALLGTCARMMLRLQSIPQVVIAQVQGTATAGGCQLVASCDLAVAAEEATFALPGGKGGWFCHTPLVAVARHMSRKRALQMAFTGEPIGAAQAVQWGLINEAVPAGQLRQRTLDLLALATRGVAQSKAVGKQCFYAQVDLPLPQAYAHAVEVMASTSQTDTAKERMRAFVEKRPPRY